MFFKYSGYDSFGKKINGKVEASDLSNAKIKLKQKKIIYESISEDSLNILDFLNGAKKYKIPALQLAGVSKDLSIYLNAGISLPNAIKLINERYKTDPKMNPFFESIGNLLSEGKNFYTALESQTTVLIPEFYLQSIKVSEDGGILKNVLLELSNYLIKEHKLKKQITQSMTYPLFIVVVSVLMVGFMLSFIVPKITDIFVQNGQELPQITNIVVASGNFMGNHFLSILIVLSLFVTFFKLALVKLKEFRYNFDSFLLKVPFIGNIIELNELSRFAYMNAILLKSGVPVVQAFKMSANTLNNAVIQQLFIQASQKVVEGEKLSKILELSKTYKIDIAFIQAIAIGEETSQLESVLENLAELYSSKNSEKLGSFLTLLEPMLMLIVGGIIGFIVIAMLLPIFSMSIGK
ncbi:MAG: type II secretion system F family protein [Arcobacteraceae bacterium]|nr:type II secretion system F family protein [Arcobacteraceae bacterium]